jgi:hypothetical protein
MVSSRVCRHRACVDSGNLEARGIDHKVVTKADFVENFAAAAPSISKEFVSRKHKLNGEWMELMDKRDWLSQTPESSRGSVACWRLATQWCSQR